MTLQMKFTVIARCKVYEEGKESYTEDLELTINQEQAMGILMRFSPSHFALGDYKLSFHLDQYGATDGILLLKDDKKYIITNINQFISEVHEGYFRLLALDKFSSILEYDFSSTIDEENITDEFGE